jgi:hypothetical protein
MLAKITGWAKKNKSARKMPCIVHGIYKKLFLGDFLMAAINPNQERIQKELAIFCLQKEYQLIILPDSKDPNFIRVDISNLAERSNVNIYTTGKIVVGGKQTSLRKELEALKSQLENGLKGLLSNANPESKACSATYDIMLPDMQEQIKTSWTGLALNCETTNSPSPYISYRSKVTNANSNITITQFNNGRLMLQGKTDYFFDICCDQIEKIAHPSKKDVASRFVCSDQTALDAFVARSTPELLKLAEEETVKSLNLSYAFLDKFDQNWFVASKCLCIVGITLPEYSALVMPSSKAFEGFCKKLLVAIGLFPPNHFDSKKASFGILSDKNHPSHKTICAKEKYAETYLERIDLSLDRFRNFMMHSDNSFVTKVETAEKAISLVNEIMKEQEDIFGYFKNIFAL